MSDYDPKIVLGLSGKALSGKTSVADVLRPPLITSENEVFDSVYWEKRSFAAPLYEMATIRQKIEGAGANDRILYEVHDVLVKVFGGSPLYGAPPYDELIELVYEISLTFCEKEGKPRSFLQYVGTDMIRKNYPDIWVTYADRMTEKGYREWITLNGKREDASMSPKGNHYGVVLDDLRFKNEADWVKSEPNGFLVKYTCSELECQERSIARDGKTVSLEQLSHPSENDLNDYPDSAFDLILDTTNLSIQEQVTITLQELKAKVKYGE